MYHLTKRTTHYTLHGNVKNVVDEALLTTNDLRLAFVTRAQFPFMEWPNKNCSITYCVLADGGTKVYLETLYRQEVGEEVFAAQLADENFSINLDAWLRNSVKPS